MQSKTLDLSYLRKFCDQDEDFVQEMIQTLAEKIPEELSLLDHAIKSNDWDKGYQAIHGLKSSLYLAGLPHLQGKLESLEAQASERRNLNQVAGESKKLIEVGKDALKQLKKLQQV